MQSTQKSPLSQNVMLVLLLIGIINYYTLLPAASSIQNTQSVWISLYNPIFVIDRNEQNIFNN